MQALTANGRVVCRTLFISDVHLGSVHCKAQALLNLLKKVDCEQLYLVGDIIDVWAMKRRVYWPEAHNKVLRQLLKMSRSGIQVMYIPGNHDQNFREFCGSDFGDISLQETAVHQTADGRRFLVTHGDEFDYAVRYSRLNRAIGDIAYDGLMWVNRQINRLREKMGKPYWSLAKWVKVNVAQAEQAIRAYQDAAAHYARDHEFNGIICGHLHYPIIKDYGDTLYINDGDWVENCTALVENAQGQLQLIKAHLINSSGAQAYRHLGN